MRINTFFYSIKQGFKNIFRNKMFSLASIATMAACIFMFGLFYIVVTNFSSMVKTAEEGVAVTVFFNEEVQNDLIVAKTIFKQSGTYLYNHMRYEFTYDDENRLTNKTASKWDGVKEKWIPYFRMSYQYADNEITLSYARWNEKHQSYDKDVRKSVYEMNAENMPVAYKSNRIYHTVNLLTMAE